MSSREPYRTLVRDMIVAVLFFGTIATIGFVILLRTSRPAEPLPPDPERALLDSIYETLLGPDSTAIMPTLKRINDKLDSVCVALVQAPCADTDPIPLISETE